jgi:hypothetical protein
VAAFMTREFFIAIDPITTVHMGICNAPNTLRRAAALAEAVKERHQAFMSDPGNLQEYAAMHYMERPAEVQGVGTPGRQAGVLRSLSAVVFAAQPFCVCLLLPQRLSPLCTTVRVSHSGLSFPAEAEKDQHSSAQKEKTPKSVYRVNPNETYVSARGGETAVCVSFDEADNVPQSASSVQGTRGNLPSLEGCCWELMRCCGHPRQAV